MDGIDDKYLILQKAQLLGHTPLRESILILQVVVRMDSVVILLNISFLTILIQFLDAMQF